MDPRDRPEDDGCIWRAGVTGIRRVWITRAQPGADRTAEHLTALGFTPLVVPLLEILPLEVTPDLTAIQALAFTSTNGVSAFAARSIERCLPVLTVGDATARAAREAGFADVRSADGDLVALAALIRAEAAGRRILHPAALVPAGDLAAEVGAVAEVITVPVYDTFETQAPAPETWDAVLIHSPRAARALWADGAGRVAVALSRACAAPISATGFADVRIAPNPTETALLATLGKPGASV